MVFAGVCASSQHKGILPAIISRSTTTAIGWTTEELIMSEDVKPQHAERSRFGEKSSHPSQEVAIKALRRRHAQASSGVAERVSTSGPPEAEANLPQGSVDAISTREQPKLTTGHLDTTPLAKRFPKRIFGRGERCDRNQRHQLPAAVAKPGLVGDQSRRLCLRG
jgi:hypothetical protein